MNELKFNNGNVDLKIKEVNGNIYFDAEQSAIGLGIFLEKNNNKYVRWERVRKYLDSPQVEKGDYISEPDFYTLAIKANNSVAEKFQYWVTHEVLPSIRKHGAYMTDEKADDILNRQGLADLLQQAANQLKNKDKQIEILKPKAEKYDRYLSNKGLITITEIAKEYGMSGVKLNQFLRDKRVIYKRGNKWFVYQKYANERYVGYEIHLPEGRRSLKWTPEGEMFIRELLENNNIKPVLEQPQQLTVQETVKYSGKYYTASSIAYNLGLSEEWIMKIGEIANNLKLKPRFSDENIYCRKTLDDNGFPRWEYTQYGAALIENEINKFRLANQI
ncbi:phage antirepressor KilAC domain-containing protein [Ligilactobacillus salivarius]|uniref:phage antirepressor KilAC domain-containing protein n=1 Tax=Ligilactobacillus salivarius TaxID=1624 RepID=UPI0019599BC2|nr:phage antirepressor KilAC domain-containing protein [Ligilactobacillus salivarius]MBM6786959.1 phage antirepressor KilAC domain-containing protein [Ligilactobacillus salivarius]